MRSSLLTSEPDLIAKRKSLRRHRSFATGLLLLAVVGGGALVVTLLVSAAEPAPAQAWILGLPSPGQVISGLLGGIVLLFGGRRGMQIVGTSLGVLLLLGSVTALID